MEFEIEILGSDWKVKLKKMSDDERLGNNATGFTDWTMREIVIMDIRGDTSLGNPCRFMKKVLRHELVHAFMFESGLGDDWEHQESGHDETVVDWIALQLHKLDLACITAESKLTALLNKENNCGG